MNYIFCLIYNLLLYEKRLQFIDVQSPPNRTIDKKCTQVSKVFLHCHFSLNNTFPKALIKLFLLQQSL